MATAGAGNTGPRQPVLVHNILLLRSQLGRTEVSTEPRSQLKGARPPVPRCLLHVYKSFALLIRGSVGHTLPEPQKVRVGRSRRKGRLGMRGGQGNVVHFLFSGSYLLMLWVHTGDHSTKVLTGEKCLIAASRWWDDYTPSYEMPF